MGQRATDPSSQLSETDTLESLRDEMVRFTYEMQSRLEMLTAQVTQKLADPVCQVSEQSEIEAHPVATLPVEIQSVEIQSVEIQSVEAQSTQPILATTQQPVAVESEQYTAELTNVASAAQRSEPTALTQASDPLERLAAIKLRIEQQQAKEANR